MSSECDITLELYCKLAAVAADKDVDERHDEFLNHLYSHLKKKMPSGMLATMYVIRKLREQPNCARFKPLLNELVCEDDQNENDPSALWTNSINRGGLVKITSEANQIFQAIECCLRHYVYECKKIPQMDEGYKS